MNNSPRHNVGSVADPHWVVDEEHYEKLQAELAAARDEIARLTKRKDERSNGWDEALAQRDAAVAALKELNNAVEIFGAMILTNRSMIIYTEMAYASNRASTILKECGK
jgi:hypothetical protein